MGWFSKHFKGKGVDRHGSDPSDDAPPPAWAPAVEQSRADGLYNEAPEDENKGGFDYEPVVDVDQI